MKKYIFLRSLSDDVKQLNHFEIKWIIVVFSLVSITFFTTYITYISFFLLKFSGKSAPSIE